ncbi:MAG: hypothetical protein IJJ10_06680 [Bacillus sp. (in: Bacteria)]|nr:hypothetical protein [Bacillus sp. (in: firmicutes)]
MLSDQKNNAVLTEEEAADYMEYQAGSRYVPKYNYEKPLNSLFIFTTDQSVWKPQYDSTNGLLLYAMGVIGETHKKYRLWFSQNNQVTLNRGQSGDSDIQKAVTLIIGYEFESKDIVTRFNNCIALLNNQYGSSFTTITEITQIPTSLKQIIDTLILAGVDVVAIGTVIDVLILVFAYKDTLTPQQIRLILDDWDFIDVRPIHMFGTTKGYWETEDIYEWENYYSGIRTVYKHLDAGFGYGNSTLTRCVITTNTNQGTTITGTSVDLSLVDNYAVFFEEM